MRQDLVSLQEGREVLSVSIWNTTSSRQSTQNGSGTAATSFCVDLEHHLLTPIDTERFGLAGDREPDVSVWLGDRVEDDVFVFDAEPGEIEG
jgi:hypothetical protein